MNIDLEELAAIIELLDKTDFTDFRFEKGDLRIAVSRGGSAASFASAPPVAPAASSPAIGAAATTPPITALPGDGASPSTLVKPGGGNGIEAARARGDAIVAAPVLGTFYRSPKPGEPAFVQIGEAVEAGAYVCIIEVMKLFNSVSAGVDGEITGIFASDGDLVEFGQPLFAIRNAA